MNVTFLRYVFHVVCCVLILANVFFCVFCDSLPASWTKPKQTDLPLICNSGEKNGSIGVGTGKLAEDNHHMDKDHA